MIQDEPTIYICQIRQKSIENPSVILYNYYISNLFLNATAKTRKKEQNSDMKQEDYLQYQIQYDYAGKFTSQGTWIHPIGTYETWEIIYMIRGRAHLYEGDRQLTANAGDVVLFRPGVEHGGTAESEETVSFFWVHGKAEGEKAITALRRLPLHAVNLQHTQIPLLCRQLLNVSSTPQYPNSVHNALLGIIFTEYAMHTLSQTKQESAEHHLINDIAEYIRINAMHAMHTSDIAVHFGYNEDYLTRLFHRIHGVGLKGYIDRMRMNHIRTLLLSTDLPLKSIAAQSGFDDYKAFLKYFTYHEDMTPTELRQRFYRTHTNNW